MAQASSASTWLALAILAAGRGESDDGVRAIISGLAALRTGLEREGEVGRARGYKMEHVFGSFLVFQNDYING